jgi:hypothetical protein
MKNIKNQAKINETWSSAIKHIVGNAVSEGVLDSRMDWLCALADTHYQDAINESASIEVGGTTTPLSHLFNTVGIANPALAQQVAGGPGEQRNPATFGSGDKWPMFMPMAIQVGARTVGFDLVNVQPMDGPTGVLPFTDYVYSDAKAPFGATPAYNHATANPQYGLGHKKGDTAPAYEAYGVPAAFKATLVLDASAGITKRELAKELGRLAREGKNEILLGTADEGIKVEFIGLSRLNASPMFKVLSSTAKSLGSLFADEAGVTVDFEGLHFTLTRPKLVSMLEDHILGYVGSGKYDSASWTGTFQNPFKIYNPMDRATGETQMPRHLSLQVSEQFVRVGKIQVAVAVTREQVQDLQKQWGIDVLKMVEAAAINELTMTINRHILSVLFGLGWLNHVQAYEAEGINMNVSFDETTAADATVGFAVPDAELEEGRIINMPLPKMHEYGSFENLDTRFARVAKLVKSAGNVIMQRGRRGPANFVVTNWKIASMLQDQSQYTFAPLANTFNQNNGQLYPLGTLAGMTVYVDPLMRTDDTRILVGRKGEKQEPGLYFCPYLMAESVNFINPGTMAPKVVVSSRYQLVTAGWWPETQYLTVFVNTPENLY